MLGIKEDLWRQEIQMIKVSCQCQMLFSGLDLPEFLHLPLNERKRVREKEKEADAHRDNTQDCLFK